MAEEVVVAEEDHTKVAELRDLVDETWSELR